MRPKQPVTSLAWEQLADVRVAGQTLERYFDGTLLVLSGSADMEYRGLIVPTFHVSVSVPFSNRRATDAEVEVVRRAFDMQDAEEDNHSSSVHRNLFRPAHLPKGTVGICECKEDEETVVESDGFQWQRKKREHSSNRGGAVKSPAEIDP